MEGVAELPAVVGELARYLGGAFLDRGVDYRQAPRTLILALNVDCRYCTRSVPFYNRLAEARQKTAGQFNIVAAFINKDGDRVRS